MVLAAPLAFKGGYLMNVLVFVGIHTMLAIGLNLLLGYAGQISLGHAGFFGLGAYLSGILTTTYTWNPWIAMPLAALFVGGLAFLIGFPILKLKGHYLAMATLGLGIIIYIVFNETVELTGGPSGLSGIPSLSIGTFTFDSDVKNYYLIWTITLATILMALNLASSRVGSGRQCPPAQGTDICPVGRNFIHSRQSLCTYHDLCVTRFLRLQFLH